MLKLDVRWLLVPALLFGGASSLEAQAAGTIRGRVTDVGTGAPVTDAQIRVEGSARGAVTRGDGTYVITEVPAGAYTLTARRLGYALERRQVTVAAGETTTQDFTLRVAAVTLGDVITSGTATPSERGQVGTNIASVDGDEINDAPGVTAIDQALQGRVAGAIISENSGQPGGGVSIRLRGTNSILGGAEPLYVIDGVIVDNSSQALVSIGANATYSGAALSNRMADIDPNDVERIEILKGAAASAIYGSRANNGVIQIFTKRGRSGAPRITASTEMSFSEIAKKYDLNMAPTASAADVSFGGITGLAFGDPVTRYDIQDQIFRTGGGMTHRLSASGGSGNTSYYVGGSYQEEEGIVRANDYERLSLRANLNQQLGEKFDLAVRGNIVRSLANFVLEGEQGNGVITSLVFTPTSWNPNFDESIGRYPYNRILGANPLDVIENWRAPEEVTRFLGSIEGTWRPRDDLTIRYLAGVDDYRRDVTLFIPPQATGASFGGSIQNPILFSRLFNNDFTASHFLPLSSNLEFTTSAGFRYTDEQTEELRPATSGLTPGQILIGTGGTVQTSAQFITQLRTQSLFFEERVSFGNRLFVTGGLNWDQSSAFGPDQRSQYFPRLSVSYVADREGFWAERMEDSFLSSLRLRAAYGETGGQPPGIYSRFSNYAGTTYGGFSGLFPSTLAGNPDLKPERQREIEGGFDVGFFDDRAQLEFTAYDKYTTDLVLSVPLAPTSGFSSQFQNIGELSNKGIELALNTVNISRENFAWRTRFTYAANRNNVEKLRTSTDTLIFGYLNAVTEGKPLGVFYGGDYARNADGSRYYAESVIRGETVLLPRRARDTLPSGTIVNSSRLIGDPNPDFVATFGTEFDFGKFVTLSALFDGRFGNDVANFTRRIQDHFGASKNAEREIRGDTIQGTYILANYGRTLIYEEFIEDGSYVKLREIALNLRVPPSYTQFVRADGATLRLAGRNLYTWTDYSGLDPEVNMFSANTAARGVDFATIPLPRQFSVGLSLNY